jgi:hypothetical protein
MRAPKAPWDAPGLPSALLHFQEAGGQGQAHCDSVWAALTAIALPENWSHIRLFFIRARLLYTVSCDGGGGVH